MAFLFALLLVLSFIESSNGILFTDLQNSLEVTAKPLRDDGTALQAGEDIVRITWKLNSSATTDAAIKAVKVGLCYAPISQVDRPWRKTHVDLSRDKTCPYVIMFKPYEKTLQTLDWIIELDIPKGTYFVRVYGVDVNGHEVAYGQSTDEDKTMSLFEVEGVSGHTTSIEIAQVCFSAFSLVSMFVFFDWEKKKERRARTEEAEDGSLSSAV